jgi:hypothetical protein
LLVEESERLLDKTSFAPTKIDKFGAIPVLNFKTNIK